jgi:hypothetical protein
MEERRTVARVTLFEPAGRKGRGVLVWRHAVEGVGGGGDHGQWEAGTDPGTTGMGGARRGFKTG